MHTEQVTCKQKKVESQIKEECYTCTKRLPSAFIFTTMRKRITFKRLDQKDILNVATSASFIFSIINVSDVNTATIPKNTKH